jgi:hypothetical protein
MEISQSILGDEINEVFTSGPTGSNFTWQIILSYKSDKGDEKYEPLKITGFTIKRDYVRGFADEITCRVVASLGKYVYKIHANRDKLYCTLIKKYISESNDSEDSRKDILTEQFKVILLNKETAPTIGQGVETTDEESLDLVSLVDVDLQLIPLSIEKIRKIQVGGIYSNTKLDSLISTLITNESSKINVDADQKLVGVDITPISNNDSKRSIVVPHGTLLIDVADYLQKRIGVYNASIGSYIQDKFWYIFPLYDTSRFEDIKDTLTVFILPKKKFHNVERTYLYKNGSRRILVTGQTAFKDDNGTRFLNQGSGSRSTDAATLMGEGSKTKDNKTIVARGKLNTEYVVDKNANYAPVSSDKITSNPFTSLSQVNFRGGGEFRAVWQNCDPNFLKPGIQTKILYDDEGKIKELYGVLIQVTYLSIPLGGMIGTRYSNQAELVFFVKKKK